MAKTKCFVLLAFSVYICLANDEGNQNTYYHNEFAVEVPSGASAADRIAAKYGFINSGNILEDFYLFRHNRIRKRSVTPAVDRHAELASDPEVVWVEQQIEKIRMKRDDPHQLPFRDHVYVDSPPPINRQPRQFFPNGFPSSFGRISIFKAPPVNVNPSRRGSRQFPDPLFPQQWYLSEGAVGGHDMNVISAWAKGYTGKKVVISILDDGIQHNHPDLAQNYDPQASTDINDGDHDPMPRDNGDNKHGTRCAGEVASVAFNDYCGVGIAYNASVGGVRMLDGTVNDAVEATAISLNPHHVDIYSASWGPEDDGKTVDGPGPLAKRAFINGVIRGRHGKGSIFVWASGNGGRHTDNCNCDGYTNSIFTLSISSASQRGFKPWYLEECSSTLASTYSSGTPGLDRSVATADMDGSLRRDRMCTVDHTGTSASAPLAAGLCALALEANPDLSWRDMQHLVVRTSRKEPLEQEKGWFVNAVGRWVSHKFGYGLMDAGAMVSLAEKWTTVPPQHVCQTVVDRADLTIPTIRGSSIEAKITTDGCAGTTGEVRYLEHVQAVVSLRFLPRGNINLKLVSPSGTMSTLLHERPRDILSEKFDDWPFLSVHFWGEKAAGTWKLLVTNAGSKQSSHPGVLIHWQLILHGTKENPERLRFSPSFNQFGSDLLFGGSINHEVYEDLSSVTTRSPYNPHQALEKERMRNKIDKSNRKETFNLEKCHSECLGGCSGTGPLKCKSCRHFILQDECVSSCPHGTYGSEDKDCLPCHGSCEECVGPRINQCSNCPIDSLFVAHLGICVDECPMQYFVVNGSCERCNNQCAECLSDSTCLKCDHRLLLHNGTCHASCPEGFYESDNNTCEKCSTSCATCVGNRSDECASCRPSLALYEGKCVSKCADGSFKELASGLCKMCPLGCASCSKNRCKSCNDGWRIKSNTCVAFASSECKIDEFKNGSVCSSCHSSCMSCMGETDSDCLQCFRPSFLTKGKCVPSCYERHYPYMHSCLPCPNGCAQCDSSARCVDCLPRYHLYQHKCLPSCPDGYFSDKRQCVRCEESCASCWGPHENQCLTCLSGDMVVDSSCKKSCPQGFFQEDTSCHPCYHNCKSCNGTGLHSCTSCNDYFTLDNGMCMECRSGRYYNLSSEMCVDCHDSCLTCNGDDETSCTTCQAPYSLHPETRTCRLCCEAKQPEESLLDDHCCQCDNTTGQCVGSVSTDKRRTASRLHEPHDSPTSELLSSTSSIVVALCLVNFIIFTTLITLWKIKSWKRSGGISSYTYRRLPTVTSKRGSYSVAKASFSDDDSDNSDEYQELFTRTNQL